MTYRLQSEKSAKKFSYTKTDEEEQIFRVPCSTKTQKNFSEVLKSFLPLFFWLFI